MPDKKKESNDDDDTKGKKRYLSRRRRYGGRKKKLNYFSFFPFFSPPSRGRAVVERQLRAPLRAVGLGERPDPLVEARGEGLLHVDKLKKGKRERKKRKEMMSVRGRKKTERKKTQNAKALFSPRYPFWSALAECR